MRHCRAAILAAWVATAIAGSARADNRLVIDQVVLEPDVLGGKRLRVYISAMSLEGGLVDISDTNAPRVSIDHQKLDAPYAIGSFNATASDAAIVVITQVSADFTDVLPTIADTFDANVLAVANDKGDHTQVAILTYGESTSPGKLTPVKAARGKIMAMAGDGSVGEPALLDSIERALVLLRKATTKPEGRPLRKMIVVIGDGRDASNDRDRVVRVGKRAAKDGVRIHTIAFSPKDIRRPLLLLGELSKQSFGTFRWVRGAKADSWTGAFQQLGSELTRQPVITWFLPADTELAGKKLSVGLGKGELESLDELKIPALSCNGATCEAGTYCAADRCITPMVAKGRGILGWVLLIGGMVLGALFVLWLIGFVIAKRQALATQIGVVPPPDMLPGQSYVMPAQQPMQSRPPKTIAMSSQPPGPAPMTSGAPRAPRIYVVSGPNAGREIPLKHGFFIGKNPGVDLLIDDGYTSGHHAQFILDGTGACRLFDYQSTNGTYVNGQRITDCVLEHGATIKIGSTELRFLAQ